MLLCLSLALQGTFRLDPWATGLAILPLTAAVGVGSTVSGPLTGRKGPRYPMLASYTCAALGALLIVVAGVHASLPLLVAGGTLLGLCSLAMPAMTAAVMSSADPAATGVASGVLNTARQTGGALGVAALGALFAASGSGDGPVPAGLGAATASCWPSGPPCRPPPVPPDGPQAGSAAGSSASRKSNSQGSVRRMEARSPFAASSSPR